MRNLDPYDGNCFEFYKSVVEKKRNPRDDPDYKTRMHSIEADIQNLYRIYNEAFDDTSLENIQPAQLNDDVISDLGRLYRYRDEKIKWLKKVLTTENGRVFNTCQNCTIGEVGSFDHILPKSEFVEFNVHPKNLFPSCTTCNSKKSTITESGGNRLFLNLYLDPLPNTQYLFVDIDATNDFLPEFYLQKPDDLDQSFYGVISSHYDRLDLLQRFQDKCSEKLTNLVNTISSNLEFNSIEEIIAVTTNKIEKDRQFFGFNYWVSILELSLLRNESFIDQFS